MAPVITTERLTKRYGDRLAVDQLDLEVQRGEVFGLLGPNGAGKTTTVLMLLGLCEPTSGTARVLGLDPNRHPLQVKARVGYLPDAVGFYGHLTGRQNLRYTTRLNGLPADLAEARIGSALAQVGMDQAADRPASQYSRGMLQRLGLADALVKDPEVLVLDEPTIAIDPQGIEELLALIRRLRDEREVTVVLSSHLLHQVQEVCDRVGIFVDGRLVAAGTIEALAGELAGDRQTVELAVEAGSDRAERIVRELVPDAEVVHDDGMLVVTTGTDLRAELVAALVGDGLSVTHVRVRDTELDDLYVRYFADDATPAHTRSSDPVAGHGSVEGPDGPTTSDAEVVA